MDQTNVTETLINPHRVLPSVEELDQLSPEIQTLQTWLIAKELARYDSAVR